MSEVIIESSLLMWKYSVFMSIISVFIMTNPTTMVKLPQVVFQMVEKENGQMVAIEVLYSS